MPPETNRSGSSRAIGPRTRTVLSVELETRSTCTVVRLTLNPAGLRWIKRSIVALTAWATAQLAGSYMWTLVQALR